MNQGSLIFAGILSGLTLVLTGVQIFWTWVRPTAPLQWSFRLLIIAQAYASLGWATVFGSLFLEYSGSGYPCALARLGAGVVVPGLASLSLVRVLFNILVAESSFRAVETNPHAPGTEQYCLITYWTRTLRPPWTPLTRVLSSAILIVGLSGPIFGGLIVIYPTEVWSASGPEGSCALAGWQIGLLIGLSGPFFLIPAFILCIKYRSGGPLRILTQEIREIFFLGFFWIFFLLCIPAEKSPVSATTIYIYLTATVLFLFPIVTWRAIFRGQDTGRSAPVGSQNIVPLLNMSGIWGCFRGTGYTMSPSHGDPVLEDTWTFQHIFAATAGNTVLEDFLSETSYSVVLSALTAIQSFTMAHNSYNTTPDLTALEALWYSARDINTQFFVLNSDLVKFILFNPKVPEETQVATRIVLDTLNTTLDPDADSTCPPPSRIFVGVETCVLEACDSLDLAEAFLNSPRGKNWVINRSAANRVQREGLHRDNTVDWNESSMVVISGE